MILVTQHDDVYEVRFPYDPRIVEHIKNVPGRRWVPEKKVWEIPRDRLGWIVNEFQNTGYESDIVIQSAEHLGENASLDPTTVIPDIDISKIPFYVKEGSQPYKHQLDFMKYAIHRQQLGIKSGFLVADEPGAGKTVEACNLAIYNQKQYGFKHCLVICCVNSSKYNWYNDIRDHTRKQYTPYILGTRLRRNGTPRSDTGGKEKWEDLSSGHMYGDINAPDLPYFLILNIEAIRYRDKKIFPVVNELIRYTDEGLLNMVVIDEVHKNMSPSSLQGKQILKLKQATGTKLMWLPMTGTPITKKPTDVFIPLKLIDGHSFSSFWAWCNEFIVYGGFGGHDIVGYKNIERLKRMLQNNMIRRLKKDVLPDLPPKINFTEFVENTPYQSKLYNTVVQDLRSHTELILSSLNPMTKLLRLRQVNGSPELVDLTLEVDKHYTSKNAKLVRALELIDEIVERDEKVVVFSNWVEPLRTLYRFVSQRHKTCTFTGTMTAEAREKHKRVFQTNPEYKVLLGTVGAAGTTHTFTAATNVIFYDEPWNPSDKEQACDRCHRIGTKSSINIYTLISKDTIDDVVHQILEDKSGVANYIVDNQLDIHKNPRLLQMLLGYK